MNNLQIFTSNEFGDIRTMTINDEPWFIGKDVTTILGYSNSRDAISKHIDDEDKGVAKCDTPGGVQNLTIINESGLYSLILSSKMPGAKRFKHWVTSEVLPSIRRNGGYIANQENLSDEELLAKALLVAKNKIAEKDKIIEEKDSRIAQMKPKEIFADAVSASRTSILIGELAKLLKQNGINVGQNRLFTWLRENGYLIKKRGTSYNMPTQASMNMGIFEIKETTSVNPDGSIRTNRTTKVTGKGQQYFINKFLGTKK